MNNQSLAQWVASRGGLAINAGSLTGEIARLRALNGVLRGSRSIVRPTGQQPDILAVWAESEGYPVTEDTFLDVLEADAIALSQGEPHRHRCYPDWEDFTVEDTDLWTENSAELLGLCEHAEHGACKVCGCCQDFDGVCDSCCKWAVWACEQTVHMFFETIREKEGKADECKHLYQN